MDGDFEYIARERRLRMSAMRHGLRMIKSGIRDPESPSWGTYGLRDGETGESYAQANDDGFGLGLDDIEFELNNLHVGDVPSADKLTLEGEA